MRKVILSLLVLFLFTGLGFSQEEGPVKKEEKKIIITTIDDDGNVTTEILDEEGSDMEEAKVWVTEEGDSIKVEIEIDDNGETKKIIKRIRIEDFDGIEGLQGLEGLEGIEGLEGLENLKDIEKNIEIYLFDDETSPHAPSMFWMDEFEGPMHFEGDKLFFYKDDEADKARLGVMIEDADKGVKVKEVVENSSAWSVGIFAGDVITHVDGKKMTNVEELQRAITAHKVGDLVDIKLKRNGKTKKFTARLQGGSSSFQFKMPGEIKDGMKRMKHHIYRGIDEFENHPRWHHKCEKKCEKKCTGDHKRAFKKEIIIDKEIEIKEKQKEMKEQMMKMKKEHKKEFKMQQKDKEILEREIEKSEENGD